MNILLIESIFIIIPLMLGIMSFYSRKESDTERHYALKTMSGILSFIFLGIVLLYFFTGPIMRSVFFITRFCFYPPVFVLIIGGVTVSYFYAAKKNDHLATQLLYILFKIISIVCVSALFIFSLTSYTFMQAAVLFNNKNSLPLPFTLFCAAALIFGSLGIYSFLSLKRTESSQKKTLKIVLGIMNILLSLASLWGPTAIIMDQSKEQPALRQQDTTVLI